MGVFWFVAGFAAAGVLGYLLLAGPRRNWLQWALIVVTMGWSVFGLGLAATTYSEGNAKGGNVFLMGAILIALVLVTILRLVARPHKAAAANK